MFDPNEGVLNTFLRLVHLGALARDWLSTPPLNTWAMIVAATWQGMGPTMMRLRLEASVTVQTRLCAVLWQGRGPVERVTPDGVV